MTLGPNPINVLNTVAQPRPGPTRNSNYVPDCDLLNPLAQDNRASGGDFCGAFSDATFGQADAEHAVRSGPADRLGQTVLQLGVLDRRAARNPAARLARRRLLPALVRQLRRHRQPERRGVGLRHVQRRRARRSAPARMAAATRCPGSRRSNAVGVRPTRGQLHDARRQLRQADRALERRRRDGATRGSPTASSCRAARAPGEPRPTTATSSTTCPKAFSTSPVPRDRVAANLPYCHVDTNWLTQVKGVGLVHDPAHRRLGVRDVPETPAPVPDLAANWAATNVGPSPPTRLGRPLAGGAQNQTVNLVDAGHGLRPVAQPARPARSPRSCGSARRGRRSTSTSTTRSTRTRS